MSTQGGSVTTSRQHTLGNGGGTFDVQGVGNSYQLNAFATINGPGQLTKTGNGTLNIQSGNSYSGGTAINGGTFLANNVAGSATGTGAVTVASGATLGGSGFIVPTTGSTATNLVTINGTDSPGNSSGTLTIGSASFDSTVVASGAYNFELSTAGLSASLNTGGSSPALPHTNHDVINVFGTIDITGLTVNIASDGSTGFNNAADYSWLIARASVSLTGTAALGTVSGTDFGDLAGGFFSLGTSGTDLYLNFTASAIPEPTTLSLLGLMAAGGGFYSWSKRKRLIGKNQVF